MIDIFANASLHKSCADRLIQAARLDLMLSLTGSHIELDVESDPRTFSCSRTKASNTKGLGITKPMKASCLLFHLSVGPFFSKLMNVEKVVNTMDSAQYVPVGQEQGHQAIRGRYPLAAMLLLTSQLVKGKTVPPGTLIVYDVTKAKQLGLFPCNTTTKPWLGLRIGYWPLEEESYTMQQRHDLFRNMFDEAPQDYSVYVMRYMLGNPNWIAGYKESVKRKPFSSLMPKMQGCSLDETIKKAPRATGRSKLKRRARDEEDRENWKQRKADTSDCILVKKETNARSIIKRKKQLFSLTPECRERIERGMFLNSDAINMAQDLLRRVSNKDGWQHTTLSQSMRFEAVSTPFVQILHDSDRAHWVCISSDQVVNLQGKPIVYIYDSLFNGTVSENISNQIRKIMGGREVDLIFLSVQKQHGYSDCGVYAIAFATHLAFGMSPVDVKFTATAMRKHLLKCLEREKMVPFQ